MNDDKTKNAMISIFLIIIVLIGFVIYLIVSLKNQAKIKNRKNDPSVGHPEDYVVDITYHNKIEKATKEQEFFDTEKCIDKYLRTLSRINKSIYSSKDENALNNKIIDNKEQIYSMLDEEYIFKYNLTVDNMDERFSYFYNNLEFLTENMYVLDDENKHESVYFVYGNMVNVDKNTIQKYGFIIRRSTRNYITIYNNSL